jgi:membrane protein
LASILVGAAPWVALAAVAALRWRPPGGPKPELSVQTTQPPEEFDRQEPGRGRLAEGPHRIPPLGWKDVLWRTYREVSHDRLTVVAGSVTFYTLLAIFPALGVFVSLYGLVADVSTVDNHLMHLAGVVPLPVLHLIGDQMTRLAAGRPATLSAAFVVSLFLSVWSANAGMKALFDGLNIAYDETERRNYFSRSALSYSFTLAALIFLVIMSAILVAAPIYFRRIGGGGDWSLWWIPLRWLALFAVATAGFAVVYRYGPCRAHARWIWVVTGAVFAAALWLIGSLGFSWYLNNVAHFDVTYGSLGAVIGFMMWIWESVIVVLIGAELNAEIEHQTACDSTTGPAKPMGERGAIVADTVGLAFSVRRAWKSAVADGRRHAGRLAGRLWRRP